jgi:hypothetical protein
MSRLCRDDEEGSFEGMNRAEVFGDQKNGSKRKLLLTCLLLSVPRPNNFS